MSLNNLAIHLATRYNLLGGVDNLNEGILLDRGALAHDQVVHVGEVGESTP